MSNVHESRTNQNQFNEGILLIDTYFTINDLRFLDILYENAVVFRKRSHYY